MLSHGVAVHPQNPPAVVRVYVGQPRTYEWLGHTLTSSIVKDPQDGPVRVLDTHLEGDRQADPAQHGGADKAVYAYAAEDVAWWAAELGRDVDDLHFGENLRTTGIDLGAAVIGEHWHIGTAVLQVSEPRTPCWKLGMKMRDPRFPRRFAAAGRTGVLLRVVERGELRAGDRIEVTDRPARGVTVTAINDVYYGRNPDLTPMFEAVELAGHWREWAAHRTVWHLDDERKKGLNVDA